MIHRLCVGLLLTSICTPGSSKAPDGVRLVAHRGGVVDSLRIENNLPALEEAICRGYAMVEVDIRESSDGHLVVHHDDNFSRAYGDSRRVQDLTWNQIKRLKSSPGGLRPLEFAEYCAACRGRIRLMLDTKGPDHDEEFFAEMRRALNANHLLKTAFVIGTDQSKEYFGEWAKVGVDRRQLAAAVERGEPVAERYFLFERGGMEDATVKLAQELGVEVVPSVNEFHYPDSEHLRRAEEDIRRLRGLGVRWFQVDSAYESFCRANDSSNALR